MEKKLIPWEEILVIQDRQFNEKEQQELTESIKNLKLINEINVKIANILRLESPTSSSKFRWYDYTENDKKAIRKQMTGIYHDNGYKVASDSHILIAMKEQYPEEYEGKILKKDGSFVDEKYKKYLEMFINSGIDFSGNIYKEYEFIYDNEGKTYHGIIDLLLEYDDHFEIIDWVFLLNYKHVINLFSLY